MIWGKRAFIVRMLRATRIRVIKGWASTRAKARLWDSEFASGQWTYLEQTADDPIYRYLEKYTAGGSLLDLGCGSGNTGNELDRTKYSSYTGTDISAVAVQKARLRTKQNGRQAQNEYICAPIEAFVPSRTYDVILFRESIFYVPRRRIKPVLRLYARYLAPRGAFIVRMCDRDKYKPIVKLIYEHYQMVDKCLLENTKDIILVFRPIGTVPHDSLPHDSHTVESTQCLD
jgi:2-polyprenyl-6-hydroxyphenyl methylase/3-demethylubiquinone-9 3-methyltransferase